MAQKNNLRVGEQVWSKMPKVNAELLTLTYGSLIMQVSMLKGIFRYRQTVADAEHNPILS